MDAEDGNKNSVLLHCTYGKVVGEQVFEELQVLFYDACWCYCLCLFSLRDRGPFFREIREQTIFNDDHHNGGDGGTGRVLRNPNSLDEKRLSVKFCNVKIKAQKKKRPQVHVSFVL